MVNYSGNLDATFSALADPTRRAILSRLAQEPDASVGELARPFDVSLPAISRHLSVLEHAGLLSRRREGRVHHCRVVAGPMKSAAQWIAQYGEFWDGRLDALQRYLEESVSNDGESPGKEGKPWKRRRTGSGSPARSRPRGKGSSGRGPSPS